jgi:hypothetical protein
MREREEKKGRKMYKYCPCARGKRKPEKYSLSERKKRMKKKRVREEYKIEGETEEGWRYE